MLSRVAKKLEPQLRVFALFSAALFSYCRHSRRQGGSLRLTIKPKKYNGSLLANALVRRAPMPDRLFKTL